MTAAAESSSDLPAEMQDHYSEHLADVNQDIDVVATEDIVNQKGVLIARKGARIDHATSKRLIQHKLSRPLEQQVQLSDSIDTRRIHEHWQQLLAKYPDLAQMHDRLGFEQEYRSLLSSLRLHPLIIQKLTVLPRQMPEWFEKALFCAWLAALVVKEMGMDTASLQAVMVGSLTHDVGFLHIDPQVLGKQGTLTPEEWRTIQAHVIIGQLFLADLPDMDERVPTAVLEHHERCDGTGYPLGKNGDLELLGKIIGLADNLQSIRVNRFAASGRTLRDAMPYLQMNDFTHSAEVYRAMCAVLKKSGLEPSRINPMNSIGLWAQRLYQRSALLGGFRLALLDLQQLLLDGAAIQHRFGAALLEVINNVIVKMVSAGIEDEHLLGWLKSCKDGDEAALPELNEVDLITHELAWHADHVQHTAEHYCQRCDDQAARQGMKRIMAQLADHTTRLRELPAN